MKKANRIVTIALMICMALTSGGLLYATMYASGAGTQSTQTTVAFDAPSGIRYNELTGAFEVFSGVGVSWIGSNGWVSTLGKVFSGETPTEDPTAGIWYRATRTSTYNIMSDVVYDNKSQAHLENYNSAFDNGITLEAGGKIYGRGFFLKGFPVRNADKSSALIAVNNGIIRNVNIIDAHFNNVKFGTGSATRTSAGILCAVNGSDGLIDDCGVYGVYSTDKFTNLYGIAGENSGTIMNSSNNAKLINSAGGVTYTAGITEILADSNTVNNTNNGSIVGRTPYSGAAGIAMCKADIEGIVGGNVNNGVVSAIETATGIIGGIEELDSLRMVNNTNNGELFAGETFAECLGKIKTKPRPEDIPQNGIRWNAGLGLFEIYNSAGVSYIASGFYFSATGDKQTTNPGTGYRIANGSAHYRLMNDIEYNESDAGFYEGFKDVSKAPGGRGPIILSGGIVDGGGYTMSGFPLRSVGKPGTGNYVYVTAFLAASVGTLRALSFDLGEQSWSDAVESLHGVGGLAGVLAGIIENVTLFGKVSVSLPDVIRFGGFSVANGSYRCNAADGVGDKDSREQPVFRNVISALNMHSEYGAASPFGPMVGDSKKYFHTVSNFINFGSVTGATSAAGAKVGSAIPQRSVDYKNIINYGQIICTGSSGLGAAGLFIETDWDVSSIENNFVNYGDVSSTGNAGGIYARYPGLYPRTFDGFKNYGDVQGSSVGNTGAIIGTVSHTGTVTLTNCYNNGKVGVSGDMKEGSAVRFVGNESKYWYGGGDSNISEIKS